MQNTRVLKIYRKIILVNRWTWKHKAIPQIILQGEWLKKLGFKEGKYIKVEQYKNKLIITLEKE